MTREEAIEILQGAIKKPNTKDGYLGQAIDMAIKALEQEPCEDAISREKTLAEINKRVLCYTYEVREIIKNMPSVSPKVKTGHWITSKTHIECSVCGFRFNVPRGYTLDDVSHNYCPNCGAKMIEPQESEKV